MRWMPATLIIIACCWNGGWAADASHAAELPTNDYPTVARADYVFGCMQVNGQTRDALERCSCSIDVIASFFPRIHTKRPRQSRAPARRKKCVNVPVHADAAGESR
jgi:hypothetical protein